MPDETAEPTRLLLLLHVGEGALARLDAVLRVMPVAAVIVTGARGGDGGMAQVRPLVEAAQRAGASVLIAGHPEFARSLGADGVHIPAGSDVVEAYRTARKLLGGRAIVGAGAGVSRHDAMTLGEEGADYVAFGIAERAVHREQAVEQQLELIGWWAEIFEVPCVATAVADAGTARRLAAAGADFVSLSMPGGIPTAEAESLAREWRAALEVRHEAVRLTD